MDRPLTGAVVGLRMGRNHARAMAEIPDTDLVALCDLDTDVLADVADGLPPGAPRPSVFTDYGAMLAETRPDIVAVATPNRLHAEMTIAAADCGVRAVCCEKPIAVDLGEARRMTAACEAADVRLIVNHQRRLGSDFQWMRRQITSGKIGDVYLIRGTCAGDLLSDGTHLIDSALYLAGDPGWSWVFAGYHRDDDSGDETSGGGYHASGGWRFGHPIETGMVTVAQFTDDLRVELLTGDLRVPGRPYHDVEVLGSRGALWRRGDQDEQNVLRRDAGGAWRPAEDAPGNTRRGTIPESYRRLARLLREGAGDADHPLGLPYALRGFELIMGAYESGRTGQVVRRPVSQERYPLAVALGL